MIKECSQLVENKCLDSPINFFTQHNRQNMIFRACPSFSNTNKPWYDWVNVQWVAEIIPAKVLIFVDIGAKQFKKNFVFGSTHISSPGIYAIGYSFSYGGREKAHLISNIVDYGKLMTEDDPVLGTVPQLCMFPVDCIEGSCTAVPYHVSTNTISAIDWLILKPIRDWYNIFVDLMKTSLR